MSAQDNGGPAFPPVHDPATHQFGMSLRDWFAGQALAGLLAGSGDEFGVVSVTESLIARNAYDLADAMIAERNKQ